MILKSMRPNYEFQDNGSRIRQLQKIAGSGTALSSVFLIVIVLGSILSVITNLVIGAEFEIMPIILGMLVVQSGLVATFTITERYDAFVPRALLLLYLALYSFIIIFLDHDYHLLQIALIGFPAFAVMVVGGTEGIFWTLLFATILNGTALIRGIEDGFEDFSLLKIVFSLSQIILISLFLYVVDIVARLYAHNFIEQEKANRDSQAQYQSMINSITEGLVAVNDKGVIEFVNKAGYRLLRMQPNDLIGNYASSSVIVTDDEDSVVRGVDYPVTKVLETGETIKFDSLSDVKLRASRGDSSTFHAGIAVTPVSNDDGEVLGAVMLIRDLTEVDAMDRAKNEFVSLASHQLRTPISALKWYAEKLLKKKKGDLNEAQEGYVKEITFNTSQMSSLVTDLLNVSKIELNKLEVNDEPVAVMDTLEATIEECVQSDDDRDRIVVNDHLPNKRFNLKHSDQSMFETVVNNLISNALKYSFNETAVEINVGLTKKGTVLNHEQDVVAGSDGLVLSVKDEGAGIPIENQTEIFGKLYRVDSGSDLSVDGAGLGLYVTRALVERLGGVIWFVSEEGTGSEFFVFLPVEGVDNGA